MALRDDFHHQTPAPAVPSCRFPYYVANPAAEPLGLSGYFPGSNFLGRSKRTAQRELPCVLEPKEKEHQRKKVLRNFLSWRSKQPIQTDADVKFWAWVRSINPDNVNSEDRFKSMSYEFLDKLLEKRIFRDSLEGWLSGYEESLGTGEEDSKTKVFIKFIRESISLKLYLDRVKTELLASLTPLDVDTMTEGIIIGRSQRHPEAPGVYAEGRCKKRDCSAYQVKGYFFVGTRGRFSYTMIAAGCECAGCGGKVSISMVGFLNCRWRYAGELADGKTFSGAEAIVWGYSTYDELKQYSWRDLRFYVQEFNSEQIAYLRSAIYNDISDAPEKRQKLSTTTTQKPTPTFFCVSSLLANDSDLRDYYDTLLRLEEKNEEMRSVRTALSEASMSLARLQQEEERLQRELSAVCSDTNQRYLSYRRRFAQ